jgi:hypothetical protein
MVSGEPPRLNFACAVWRVRISGGIRLSEGIESTSTEGAANAGNSVGHDDFTPVSRYQGMAGNLTTGTMGIAKAGPFHSVPGIAGCASMVNPQTC